MCLNSSSGFIAEIYSRSRSRRMSRSEFSLLFLWKKCKDLKFSVGILMILFNELTLFVKHQSGVEWSEVGKNIWLSSLFFVGKPQKNWQPLFASKHTNNALNSTSQLFFFDKLEGERISTFRPTRILISYYLTSASLSVIIQHWTPS